MEDKYQITANEARKRLERRYDEQAALFPLTLLIPKRRYVRVNIKQVRKFSLLKAYASEVYRNG